MYNCSVFFFIFINCLLLNVKVEIKGYMKITFQGYVVYYTSSIGILELWRVCEKL